MVAPFIYYYIYYIFIYYILVYESKIFGVYIDLKINWKYHIDKTRCKSSKSLSILYKANTVLDSHNLCTIYCSIMMSYFSCCSEILGGTYDSNIEALIVLQKRAIHVVCKCSKYDHANILFSKLSTLKLKDIIKYKTGIVMYRAYYNFLPDNVQILIATRKSHYNTRNSYNSNLPKFCIGTNLRQMSISYHGINVWNKLDPEVICATTVSDCKK